MQLEIRLSPLYLQHSRVVYGILNFVGNVGGLKEAVMFIAATFMANYGSSQFEFSVLKSLFKVNDSHDPKNKKNC